MSATTEAAAAAKLAYVDTPRAAYKVGKATHRRAKIIGMYVMNWRHKGAGTAGAATPIVTPDLTPARKAKSWTSDEESFSNTTTSHTTYTRKRTR